MTGSDPAPPIGPVAAAAVTALVGLGLFAALWLFAHAGALSSRAQTAVGPASKAAEGLYGLTVLLREEGVNAVVLTGADPGPRDALLVVPLGAGANIVEVKRRIRERRALLILPKWRRPPLPRHADWSDVGAPDPFAAAAALRALAGPSTVTLVGPASALDWRDDAAAAPLKAAPAVPFQVMTGPRLVPLLSEPTGRFVLARLQGTQTTILSDPDLVDNEGLASLRGATAASLIIRRLAAGGPVAFAAADRAAAARSAVQLLFERPFGAATVCLCLAAVLASLQAFFRFGPARPIERPYALGKRALVESAASLLTVAGRERGLAPRYLELALRRTATVLGLDPALAPNARNGLLERAAERRGLPPLSGLAARAGALRTRRDLLAWAVDLHQWSEEMIRGRP